jgi:hypothetical protein
MSRTSTLALLLVLGLTAASPALGQDALPAGASGVVNAAALEAAVTDHERGSDRTRADLADLLAHDDVREIAEARGFDLDHAAAAVETLSDSQMAAAAPLVERATAALQRGTITISATAVIIILLLLILLT